MATSRTEQRHRDALDSEEESRLQRGTRLSSMDQESIPYSPPPDNRKMSTKRAADEDLDRRRPRRSRVESKVGFRSSSSTEPRVTKDFPNVALRITRIPGRNNQKDCTNLGDLIHKDHLVSACLYAFYIATTELFRHLPLSYSSDDVPVSSDFRYNSQN